MNNIRIDDIGAAAKLYAKHIKPRINLFGKRIPLPRFLNIGLLRTSKLLRGWAKYEELEPEEWDKILNIFQDYSQIPIIAITACWVESGSKMIPFPDKFPREAEFLKSKLKEKHIIIANHGLTHCVLGKQNPGIFGSNQTYWREFHLYLDSSIHEGHILKSQQILEGYFEEAVTCFVPPGNVWCKATYEALKKTNIKTVISNRYMSDYDAEMDGIKYVDDKYGILNIHDRELKLFGPSWLREQLEKRLPLS